jgi:hypothetical protein
MKIHSSRLHRFYRHRYGTTPRDYDGREIVTIRFDAFDQCNTTHTGHQGIDQKASAGVRTVGVEEGSAI